MTDPTVAASTAWPPLPLEAWRDTYETLHMWTQIVGKTRLALAPMENHWWQIALYVIPRGLTTSTMPHGHRALAVDFDFLDHHLHLRTSDGVGCSLKLASRPVADFYAEYREALRSLDVDVPIYPVPVEVETAIPFAEDRTHRTYDAEAAQRWWRALMQADRVLKRFRGRFLGKQSPVHFFWGSFDLAATRFSGRPAPRHPGGAPNCPNYVMEEAYSRECCSCGFWPGGGALAEPAFYAYAYPEPAGYSAHPVRPDGAAYHAEAREFILPYEVVRSAANPDETLLEFVQSTYEAAADLARWDRGVLDRQPTEWP
jgi:hypothetical protein